jgi:hypothetical protein
VWSSPNPDPFETERVGHPEKPDQSLGVDVLEWYHSTLRVRQQKKRERVIQPSPDFDFIVDLLYIVEVCFWRA